tara:strand:- start:1405 stop:1689 length:285 start_codon:yes stop_codon:yes gene_type:complete
MGGMKIYLLINIPNGSYDIPTDRDRFYKDFEVVGAYGNREVAESSIPENAMDHNYDIVEKEIDFTKKKQIAVLTKDAKAYIENNGDCSALHHDD